MEQRYKAVLEVLDGATVTDVARRNGVVRQTVHDWLGRYAAGGLASLADHSSKPASCPHQMAPEVEARIVEMRRAHPAWGPRTIVHYLARGGVDPVPGRSSVHRALIRHGLIDPKRRKRRRADYRRWERSRAMELWQMDVMGGVRLQDGTEAKVVTGIDDHSRFCVAAHVVARATARPVCDALAEAMRTHGVPEAILTDNGKVFTGRFGLGRGDVLFDRICKENGIRHLLTAAHSPTTTGKVERFHKTVRRDFLGDRVFADIDAAQAAFDAWVIEYNTTRPHQSLGDRPPADRFALVETQAAQPVVLEGQPSVDPEPALVARPATTRRVHASGRITLARFDYHVGRWLAGHTVELRCEGGLLQVFDGEALVATHALRRPPDTQPPARRSPVPTRARPVTTGTPVTRKVDSSGNVSFAGANYRAGNAYRRRQVEVSVVRDTVQISLNGKVIRTHRVRHDRSKEHGAFANPGGRPRRINAA
jgi:transposase InsO family protein